MSPTASNLRFQITSVKWQGILLGLWMLMGALSYPRANLWLLAYGALAPLGLLAVRGKVTWRGGVLVYLAGFVWWAWMVRWLWPVTGPGYLALCAYLGLYLPAFVLVTGYIHRRFPLPMVVLVPVVWVGLEYVRGIALSGFPWFGLGHSQPTVMIQIADLAGAYGVSFVVAMTGGLLVDVLICPIMQRDGAGRKRMGRTLRLSVTIWAAAMAGTVGYGMLRLGQGRGSGADGGDAGSIKVAVVQTDVPQDNKTNPTDEQDNANFARFMELHRQAARSKPDLIVSPETALPREINDESYALFRRLGPKAARQNVYRDQLSRFAKEQGVALLVGAHAHEGWHVVEDGTGGGFWRPTRRYNSVYLFDATGRIADRYDKIHRVPFGEYVPWVSGWPWARRMFIRYMTPYDEDYSLTPGGRHTIFMIEYGKARGEVTRANVATPICFEDVISKICRRMCYGRHGKRVDLLANLTNDGWYPGSAEAPQHEQIARFRCVENRVPMVRAVNRGVSGFIDSAGRIVGVVSVAGKRQEVAAVAVAHCRFDGRGTLFGRIGDAFAVLCLIGTGLLIVLAWLLGRAGRTRQ